jgi:hypothetical protein
VESARNGATQKDEGPRRNVGTGNGKRGNSRRDEKANTKGKWEGLPKAGSRRFRENGAMFVREAFQVGFRKGPEQGRVTALHKIAQNPKVSLRLLFPSIMSNEVLGIGQNR